MQVFLDRYAGCRTIDFDRPEYLGGNIPALIDKLDYLQWLGVNCLWISPFYRGSAYHGYHITNFFEVDPRFGSRAELVRLLEESHRRGIRVLADFVPNHCSYLHSSFIDAQARADSPYRDWFFFTHWPDRYLCFLGFDVLPKLNLNNLAARQHVIDAAVYWMDLGFDGLRLDHAIGPGFEFWQALRREVKRKHPQSILIGEVATFGIQARDTTTLGIRHKWWRLVWGAKSETLYREYAEVFDAVLDFEVQSCLKRYAESTMKHSDRAGLTRALQRHYRALPSSTLFPAFLDNHDMDRILYCCGQNKEKLKRCAEVLFSLEQPIIIYYGTESGMSQEAPFISRTAHADLLARRPMNWNDMDQDLVNFFRTLIRNRTAPINAG